MQPFYAVIIPLGASPGGDPPRIWGPTDPRPTPPIHLGPGGEVGGPPTIWGPTDPRPTPPIVIPPDGPPPGEQPPTGQLPNLTWHTVWTEQYGWAVVGLNEDPHPTPSKKGK